MINLRFSASLPKNIQNEVPQAVVPPKAEIVKSTFLGKLKYRLATAYFAICCLVGAILYVPLTFTILPLFPMTTKWGVEKLDSAPKGIIAMNHQSAWDFFVICFIYHLLGDRIHTLSRIEVYNLWPLGYCMHQSGSIFIDLKSPRGAINDLIEESRKVFTPGSKLRSKIIIFPEGTRNSKIGKFLQFKRGAFRVALEANVPIIPIVCSPHAFVRDFKTQNLSLIVRCLDPVRLDPGQDLDTQIERVKSDMQAEFYKQLDELGIKPDDA